jgi:protein CpxP
MVSFHNMTKSAAAAALSLALLGGTALTGGAIAQTAQPAPVEKPAAKAPTAATKTAPGSGGAAARVYSTPERVEARINELHQKLAITADQEPQWKKLADTMRDNAKEVEEKAAERQKALQTMTVIDDLRSYEGLAKAHAESMTRLVASFEPLYASMSPEQKKRADAEFQGYRKRVDNKQQSMTQ